MVRICAAPTQSLASHYGLVEREPWLGAVPLDKVADGVFVRPSRVQRRKAVENCRFGIVKVGKLENTLWFLRSFRHEDGILAVAKGFLGIACGDMLNCMISLGLSNSEMSGGPQPPLEVLRALGEAAAWCSRHPLRADRLRSSSRRVRWAQPPIGTSEERRHTTVCLSKTQCEIFIVQNQKFDAQVPPKEE